MKAAFKGLAVLFLFAEPAIEGQVLNLPPRPASAPTGSEFARRVDKLELARREEAAVFQILSGNVPDFLRRLHAVLVTEVRDGRTNTATLHVMPDYLAVGTDQDYFLLPLTPAAGQRFADALDCSLPTRKIVDAIHAAAEVKLVPQPIPPSAAMTSVSVFSNHNYRVRAQRVAYEGLFPLGALVAGHQKDVVLSPKLSSAPGKVAIYGWHETNGRPIQPLYLGHSASWVDYSHGIRLVLQTIALNGKAHRLAEVLTDPERAGLLSDEGPFLAPRYPTNLPAVSGVTTKLPTFPAGFRPEPEFHERTAWFTFEPGVRVHINAPASLPSGDSPGVQLVLYALPNGNTIEQTVGKSRQEGDDWRFDIQHIGAQTRYLRERSPTRSLVVAYLECDTKSWPAWRKQHGDQLIPKIVQAVREIFGGRQTEIVLTGHSGGGSFTFGFLNAVREIPDSVGRIAFLDSNYAYDGAKGHTEKLVRWLNADEDHALCVFAYDDARALLEGKAFVSPSGGTWARSHAMQADLAAHFSFSTNCTAEFQTFSALGGRVRFILKENPERKILHTVQVERNGFIHALLLNTPREGEGYTYFGERAYSRWIANGN